MSPRVVALFGLVREASELLVCVFGSFLSSSGLNALISLDGEENNLMPFCEFLIILAKFLNDSGEHYSYLFSALGAFV